MVLGLGFSHVLYRNRPKLPSGTLHVYLDGDGTPWFRGTWIARDPTPRNPLMLRLMSRDKVPSVYLGRPCYHGQAGESGCRPNLWTFGRYKGEVVDSMSAALFRVMHQGGFSGLVLIGYSGGGTLAMLLASRPLPVAALVTLAGNLDPDAWARLHHYRPLTQSMNPAAQPPLATGILQLHYVGAKDRNIPPSLIEPEATRQNATVFQVIPGYDHDCCWEQQWVEILAQLSSMLAAGDQR